MKYTAIAYPIQIYVGYNFTSSDFGSLAFHRIVESFKFAFGQRLQLGDPAFNDTVNEVYNSWSALFACTKDQALHDYGAYSP